MDILSQLTEKIDVLVERQEALRLENLQLQEDLEVAHRAKDEVLARVENILKRLQEIDMNF